MFTIQIIRKYYWKLCVYYYVRQTELNVNDVLKSNKNIYTKHSPEVGKLFCLSIHDYLFTMQSAKCKVKFNELIWPQQQNFYCAIIGCVKILDQLSPLTDRLDKPVDQLSNGKYSSVILLKLINLSTFFVKHLGSWFRYFLVGRFCLSQYKKKRLSDQFVNDDHLVMTFTSTLGYYHFILR